MWRVKVKQHHYSDHFGRRTTINGDSALFGRTWRHVFARATVMSDFEAENIAVMSRSREIASCFY